MVVPQLIQVLWRRHMVKEAELVFTVPVIMQFWRLRENELLIIDLFLPVV